MEIPYTVELRRDTGLNNGKIGIWLFLASEVMLFGGLFSAYVLLRSGAVDWPHGRDLLDTWSGIVNTGVLLAAAGFVRRATRMAARSDSRPARTALTIATSLGVVVYSRANAVLGEEALDQACHRNPTLVGFKDGVGRIEQMTRTYARMGDRLTYIGGLPTAEVFALPLLQLGVTTYSSALFNFVPEFALDFYAAVRKQDQDAVYAMLRDFVIPYTYLRDREPGYAVAIVKAGLKVVGRPAGPVRPPLSDLTEAEVAELSTLVAAVGGSGA
jgi:hypothetical protein